MKATPKKETTFTVKGYAVEQGKPTAIPDLPKSVIWLPKKWAGKDVVCILTEDK